jgi:O-antigen/teichoic acid export membrane protein
MIQSLVNRFNASNSMRSGAWVLVGLLGSQLIRLASNLVLTRLLLPEYFGLMGILLSMMGLFHMILDIGLVPSIVNTSRQNDPLFMRTAWTVQVVRSFIVGTIAIIAAYPVSIIYSEPRLFPLIVVTGLSVYVSGFSSTAVILNQRNLDQKPLVIMQIGTQILSTLLMIALAWHFRSVWALLSGMVFAELLGAVSSYIFFKPHHSKFCWDKEAVREIVGFGRWVFISSIFGYIALRSDVAIMGLWLTLDELGKYSIAAIFAGLLEMVSGNLSVKIFHPHFKKMMDEAENFVGVHRIRLQLNLIMGLMCCVLAVGGDLIIRLLYDPRYWSAGWMLQILAIGKMGAVLSWTLQPVLLAKKDSFSVMVRQMLYSAILVAGLFLGAYWRGSEGLILVYAMIPMFGHIITVVMARRHGFYCAISDTMVTALVIGLVVLGWFVIDAPILDVLNAELHNRPIG